MEVLRRKSRGRRLRLVLATVAILLLAGCGDEVRPSEAAAAEFDRAVFAAAIAGDALALSARLASPTNDGAGDVRVEVDRRPDDVTIRLAVSITRGSEELAIEVMEIGDRTYLRDTDGNAEDGWVSTVRGTAGTNTTRVESLLHAFPVVGDIAATVRAQGWTFRGAEPCPGAAVCFVLTNPAFEFASLFVDVLTHRPVHMRLARPGMRAAGEIEIDWIATGPVEPPTNAREIDAENFQAALEPVLQALGL